MKFYWAGLLHRNRIDGLTKNFNALYELPVSGRTFEMEKLLYELRQPKQVLIPPQNQSQRALLAVIQESNVTYLT